jgi:electron transport complex protein RnfE
MPGLSDRLGIFVPLLTVNTLILDRALNFAKENTPSMSFWDALGMGTGFLLALLGIALIREVLGSGTITLVPVGSFSGVIMIPGLSQSPIRLVSLSAGAFLILGYTKAVFDIVYPRAKNAAEGDKP